MAGDARAKELIDLGSGLFRKKDPLNTLHQEIAENFYVERADFTSPHSYGESFADHLMDSFPSLLRRELGNSISAMLRPRDREWFGLTTLDEGRDRAVMNAEYLEYVCRQMKRAMYDPRSKFVRSTKEADHDFVSFGNTVISVEESPTRDHLFYRSFHLRDCVWLENQLGDVDHLHRNDKFTARKMKQAFGEKVLDRTVKEACKKNPSQEFNIRCVVMPSDEYDYTKSDGKRSGKRLPFVVIYIDADNCKILRESGKADFPYVVPRWHTVPGMQYAFSPCATIALPDARMIQMMAQIILEAGEKSVDPPIVAVEEAVREVNLAAGAITWADIAFDGKLREAVQPIQIENNMSVAFSMRQDMRDLLSRAWFVDKLTMPPASGADQMTAAEINVRQQEFVRNLLPLFEPMEVEYNSRILDKSYNLMMAMGAFPIEQVPDNLKSADTVWSFESPIQITQRRQLANQFQETIGLIAAGMQAGVQSAPVNLELALKDAIYGIGAPSRWMKDEEQIAQETAEAQEAAQMEQAMMEVSGASQVAGQVADTSQRVGQAMLPPAQTMKALPPPKRAA
jgi:hypothetical protein